MKISVTIKPGARREEVLLQDDGSLRVSVAAPPVEGKANERLIELLAKHYRVPKSRIAIIKGATARKKIVEIDGGPFV